MTDKSSNDVATKARPILKIVYSENETENYSPETGKRLENYRNGPIKKSGFLNSPQDGNVRHFSVNDANENKNVLKNKLWKQFAHQKRNLKADKNLSLLKIEETHEDNRMESD